MVAARWIVGLWTLTCCIAPASGADPDEARRQFDLHNYKAALAALEGLDVDAIGTGQGAEAAILRARCLLKLQQWEEGMAAMQEAFARHETVADRPELHVELAEAAAQVHEHRNVAVRHFEIAVNQFETLGNRSGAFDAAIQCARVFVHFDAWDKLGDAAIAPAKNWEESRRLQRRFALQWLNRAIALSPDDDRTAAVMIEKARLLYRQFNMEEGDVDSAIQLFKEIVQRFEDAKVAEASALELGRVYEQYKSDYATAAGYYRRVIERFGGSRSAQQAAASLKQIVEPVVRFGAVGVTLPGASARIDVEVRNLSRLTFKAYQVDLFEVIRKVGHVEQLERWKLEGEPAARWTVEIPDGGEHKYYRSESEEIPATALPLTEPGAYVVIASGDSTEGPAEARGLLLVSRLTVISKGAKDGGFIWAVDSVTGRPVADAMVLVQEHLANDDYRYRDGATNAEGIFELPVGAAKRRYSGGVTTIVQSGGQFAVCGSSYGWYWWGYPNDYRLYAFTDRPVYRPDQKIQYKFVLRRYEEGEYHNVPTRRIRVTVQDPCGEAVAERELVTNEHGSASGELSLASGAALGVYRFNVEVDGKGVHAGSGGAFRVEEYKKPEFEVTVSAAKGRYSYGEPVDVRIEARYYFGSPVAEAKVTYAVHRTRLTPRIDYPMPYPWYFDQMTSFWGGRDGMRAPWFCFPWRHEEKALIERGELTTDAVGVALLRIAPQEPGDADGYRYIIEAEAIDNTRRTVTGSGSVNVTRAPFALRLEPQRRHYKPGDTIAIDIKAFGPNDEPVAFDGTMRVYRLEVVESKTADGRRESIQKQGEMIAEIPMSADEAGMVRFRRSGDAEGVLRFVLTTESGGVEIRGVCDVWIAGAGGRLAHYAYRDVEVVADKYAYEIGETARVLITTRFDEALVLFTIEADDLIVRRIVEERGGSAIVEIPIEAAHCPNFYLAVELVRDNAVHEDVQPIVVPPTRQFIDVAIESARETFSPREEGRFAVTANDAQGKPIDAELAVMMVDASIYYIQPELREKIEQFFYGNIRPHMVNTQTSFDVVGHRYYDVRSRMMAKGVAAEAGGKAFSNVAGDMQAAAPAAAAEPAFAAAEIRREFPDSVLWLGHLSTGADGRADVNVRFPDTLTTWRMIAVAVDDATRVGETSRDFVTRKEVIARLQTPRFLVERDTCRIAVAARNDLDDVKTVRVSLDVKGPIEVGRAWRDGHDVEYVKPRMVEVRVEPHDEAVVDFEIVAQSTGSAVFTATVATDVQADAVEIEIPVVAFGSPKMLAESGIIREGDEAASQTIAFTLPEAMDRQTPILEVHLNPTIAGVLLDAMPYLLDYPYGCTEQTMSRFLPAVVTKRTLDRMGVKLSELAARIERVNQLAPGRRGHRGNPVFQDGVLNDMVSVGLHRLTEMQNGDGGWGWWAGGPTDAYMTAYVVYGLAEAARANRMVDPAVRRRGVEWLLKSIDQPLDDTPRWRAGGAVNVRQWMLFALSVDAPNHFKDATVRRVLDRAFEQRDELTDYTRAMLIMTLHAAGQKDRAKTVVANLDNTVKADANTETASWGQSDGYIYWYHNGMESTAMVLRALLAVAPDHPHVSGAVRWLVRNRQGARWHSTKDTAFAVYALAEYLESSGELDADMTVKVTYDGHLSESFRITPDNVLTFDARIIYAPQHLTPGRHTVRIDRVGRGNVYFASYVDFHTKEDPIGAAGLDVLVGRSYARLTPKEVKRTRRIWDGANRAYSEETYSAIDYDRAPLNEGDRLAPGDVIEVALDVDARNAFEYVMIEAPKPAGCEPVELLSSYSCDSGFCAYTEYRDKHVALFADYLPQGKHRLAYRLRCETPGEFGALPVRLEAMYSPYVRANSASNRLTISPQ